MAQGNSRFTDRLRAATAQLHEDQSLGLIHCVSGSLFTPILDGGAYRWVKILDSDGLLIVERPVKPDQGRSPESPTSLLVGAIIQSEDSTSQTKPNPLGKAALGHIPNGTWVDVTRRQRRRLDRLLVVFVIPKGATKKDAKKFATAQGYVRNVANLMPDVMAVEAGRGASASQLADALWKATRPFLKGRGRPRTG